MLGLFAYSTVVVAIFPFPLVPPTEAAEGVNGDKVYAVPIACPCPWPVLCIDAAPPAEGGPMTPDAGEEEGEPDEKFGAPVFVLIRGGERRPDSEEADAAAFGKMGDVV